jgi:sec-independent protein translocase protein TatA
MPNIGGWEIAIIVILALLIFGPKKLPELGSSLGKSIRGFKKGLKDNKEEIKATVAEVREATGVDEMKSAVAGVREAAGIDEMKSTVAEFRDAVNVKSALSLKDDAPEAKPSSAPTSDSAPENTDAAE